MDIFDVLQLIGGLLHIFSTVQIDCIRDASLKIIKIAVKSRTVERNGITALEQHTLRLYMGARLRWTAKRNVFFVATRPKRGSSGNFAGFARIIKKALRAVRFSSIIKKSL